MKHTYDDLRSLYRAATREEQPMRADRRLERAAARVLALCGWHIRSHGRKSSLRE